MANVFYATGGSGPFNTQIAWLNFTGVYLSTILSSSLSNSIPNVGNATATNVIFKDTIPTGTNLLTNTILVNGVSQPVGTNPETGINIGSISPGATTTVSFQVVVN